MSIHRRDLPDAPVRVYQSALNPTKWIWRCMDTPTHHARDFPDWGDAWAAMEKHRRTTPHLSAGVLHRAAEDLRALARSREEQP